MNIIFMKRLTQLLLKAVTLRFPWEILEYLYVREFITFHKLQKETTKPAANDIRENRDKVGLTK